jgi:Membrane dipeptidase (Peptidase family M19)
MGDFQTGTVTHHGLTSFGAEVIRACHRLGFVCDVAHATEDTVKAAVKVATKPLLLSHTALSGSPAMGPTPLTGRQISHDHARAIAETGGAIGIWHFFPSLEKFVDGLKEMVDVVGVDHVCIAAGRSGHCAGLLEMGASCRCDANGPGSSLGSNAGSTHGVKPHALRRTAANRIDVAARLSVRTTAACRLFPSGEALPSTTSAGSCLPLFGRFLGTTASSDFSPAYMLGVRLCLPEPARPTSGHG